MSALHDMEESFAKMLRHKKDQPVFSEIESRRLNIYKELFYRNIEGLLRSGFPVLSKVIGDSSWNQLVADFWLNHRCKTPYFTRISGEFVSWLYERKPSAIKNHPFLLELAHYELMEVVVDLSEVNPPGLYGAVEDLRGETILVMNPVSDLLHYDYPVHQISTEFIPEEPSNEKNHLLIYRRRDNQVKFMQLSSASVILINIVQTQARSMSALIAATEQSMNAPSGSLAAYIEQQVRDFIVREVIFI